MSMKRKLLINNKSGFTFLEVIVSVLIIGFISISFYYGISLYNKNILKAKKAYEKEKIIISTYQTLSLTPYVFKENIVRTFNGSWQISPFDGCFYETDKFTFDDKDYYITHYEDYAEIKVELYEGDDLIQSWIRAKTGIY